MSDQTYIHMSVYVFLVWAATVTEDLPQFTDETLSTSGQISGINGDEVIRCLTLFPLPASQQKHL